MRGQNGKIFFSFIVIIHGLIHLLGFFSAFKYGNFAQLIKEISRPMGMVWLTAFILFVITILLYRLNLEITDLEMNTFQLY